MRLSTPKRHHGNELKVRGLIEPAAMIKGSRMMALHLVLSTFGVQQQVHIILSYSNPLTKMLSSQVKKEDH